MTTVNIQGNLLNSTGVAYADTKIYITPIQNDTKLKGAVAEVITDTNGNYSFQLTTGQYEILILFSDTKEFTGSIIVDAGLATPSTLEAALDYSGTPIDTTFTSTQMTWADLFNDLEGSVFTSNRLVPALSQDDNQQVSHYSVKGTLFNNIIPSKKAVDLLELKADNVELDREYYTYSDTGINEITNLRTYQAISGLTFEGNRTLEKPKDSTIKFSNTDLITFGSSTLTGSTVLDSADDLTIQNQWIGTTTRDISEKSSTATKLVNSGTQLVTDVDDPHFGRFMYDVTIENGYTNQALEEVDGHRLTRNFEYRVQAANAGVIIESDLIEENAFGFININQVRSVTVASKVVKTEITNNGTIGTVRTEADKIEFGDAVDTVLDVDVANKEVTVNGKLIINAADIAGLENGKSIYDEYRYYPTDTETNYNLWHTVFTTGDKYRIQRLVTELVDGSKTYGQWSPPALLGGIDGATGDSLYYEFQYTDGTGAPNTANWHNPPMVDGDQWRRERVVTQGVAGAWSSASRIIGSDGGDGQGSRIEVEYAADATGGQAGWHTNFSEGDHFRRERLITIHADGSETAAPWQISKLVPEQGVDYGYRSSHVFIYKRYSGTKENLPKPTQQVTYNFLTGVATGLNNGWTTEIPAGTTKLWIGAATVWSLAEEDTIDTNEWVIEHMAENGAPGASGWQVATVMLYKQTDKDITSVTKPTNSTYWEFAAATFQSGWFPNNGWSQTMPANTGEGGKIWVTHAVALASAANTHDWIYSSDWSTPQVLAQNGINGTNGTGTPGEHGSGSWLVIVADHITQATVRSYTHGTYFSNASGRLAKDGDIISYVNQHTTNGFRLDFLFDGASWTEFTNIIHGNQIVHGSVAAHHLIAASVTTDKLAADAITADKISADAIDGNHISASSKIVAGSGNDIGALDGADTTYRIYAGHATPSSAPFRVDKDGNMTATSGSFSGDISGATGTFTGAVTGASFNGMRFKIGTFRSSLDTDETIYLSSTEGRLFTTAGTSSTIGGTTPAFSKLVGVSLALVTTGISSVMDLNVPVVSSSNSFIFNRDDGFNGSIVFSYIAWGY